MKSMMKFIYLNFNKVENRKIFTTLLVLLGVISSFSIGIAPLISGELIDSLVKSPTYEVIHKFISFIILVYFIQMFTMFFSQYVSTKISCTLSKSIVQNIIEHLAEVSILKKRQFLNEESYYKIYSDANELARYFISILSGTFSNVITTLLTLFLLWSINWIIGGLISFFLICSFFYLYVFRNIVLKKQIEFKNSVSEYYSAISKYTSKIEEIKLFQLKKIMDRNFSESFKNWEKTAVKYQIFSYFFYSGDSIITLLAQVTIFFFGGRAVINGEMSIGIFAVLISYFSLLLNSVKYFNQFIKNTSETYASFSRLNAILKIDKEVFGDCILKKNELDKTILDIKNLTFRFPGSERNILMDFSYKFESGNIYCIVGDNGSGKSTLLNFISRIYAEIEFDSNSYIRLNDTSISEINGECFYNTWISYLNQQALILDFSTKTNITLEKDYDLESYLKINEGLDINEERLDESIRDENLSGGEKQKVSLARVLNRNTPIFLLDEPTNHLDSMAKKYFIEKLLEIKKESIVIVSTHDARLLEFCDYVIKLNKGA